MLRSALRLAAAGLVPIILAGCASVPRTVGEDPSLPHVTLNGYRFHAEAFGREDAPVVIVLHGGPGADYRYLLGLAALADRYRVVFYDQRGSGLSDRLPASAITVQGFIDDLDAFVGAHGRGKPVRLVGHSWGAMLASAYAGAHPDKVAGMVLGEPGFLDQATMAGLPQGGWPGLRVVAGFAGAWVGKWFVRTGGDSYARDDWFMLQVLPLTQAGAQCPGQAPAMQAWRFGSPVFEATLGRMAQDGAWARSLDFSRGLERYTGPVLFLHGACNTAQGEAHQRRMMARFSPQSAARLVTLEGAGHFMFNDQPQASMAAVRELLAQAGN